MPGTLRRRPLLAWLALAASGLWSGVTIAQSALTWDALVADTRAQGLFETLEKVNRRINAFREADDRDTWRRTDYWATPQELIGRGAGDCEDFAIAKYFLLRADGIAPDRLRLMVARVYNPRGSMIESHLVLLYQATDDTEPLVLDNLRGDIVRLSERPDLFPLAKFDTQSYWTYRGDSWTLSTNAPPLLEWHRLLERWNRELAANKVATADGEP